MSTPNTEATGKPTPIAGCIIFIVILGMVTFLAIFTWYQYSKTKAEIVNISQLEQNAIEIADVKDQPSVVTLDQKMRTFETAVKAKKKAEISFTPAEINLAIAPLSQT